ncbi:multicopper oxidase domain-containing protein (plasmid) [Burkholderia thailandensis]|nr:multicopper oxidase domain-containing protein [Burkholderia thailandensis]QRA15390.1 multicopper oxidase domain-containing protein [Burkholderia thailandensis]
MRPERRRVLRMASAALLSAPALIGIARAQSGSMSMTMKGMSGDMSGMGGMSSSEAQSANAAFRRALPIPPKLMGELDSGVRRYSLRAQAGSSTLLDGLTTPTWGYNGALLGPVLSIPRGQPVHIAVKNALAQSLTTHWHGALVPGNMDGGPYSVIQAGATLDYRFTLDQPGATLWYHPHTEYRTGAQAYAGLAGMLLVDDGIDRKLGLPHTWGVDDIPVVVQDRRVAASGQLLYMTEMRDMMGMKGGHFVINGREQPYVEVPAQRVRLRLLNGSNARSYNFALSDGRAFEVIASDSGLLARPASTRTLLLSPGERAEIVVDLAKDQGKAIVLQSRSGEVVHLLGSSPDDSDEWDLRTFDLLQLRVVRPTGTSPSVPQTLADIEALPLSGARVRRITLQGMQKGAMTQMKNKVDRGASPNSGPGGMSLGIAGQKMFSMDHQFFDMTVINQQVRQGSVEIWEFVNDREMAHPLHIHGVAFQVLSRDGNPPPEWERGWKDTVLVRIGETVRVGMRFTQPAEPTHPFMYHCHILEHEGNGMMGQYTSV